MTTRHRTPARAVDLRDLRSNLHEYFRLASAGETVLVTDCGRVVAEIVPPQVGASRRADGLAEVVPISQAVTGVLEAAGVPAAAQ